MSPRKKKVVKKKATAKKVVKKKAVKKVKPPKPAVKGAHGRRVKAELSFGERGYDFYRDGVTQSLLSVFMSCRKKAKFVLDGWEKPRNKAALIFGSFFHWLIEEHVMNIAHEGVGLSTSFQKLETEWRQKIQSEGEIDPDAMELYIAMAYSLFEPYCDYWKKKDEAYEWVGVEAQFDVQLATGYKMRGMRDGIFRKNGKLWVLETKTASRIDEETLGQTLNYDLQTLYYVLATELEFKEPVAGVIYNVIRKPQLRQKKDESFPEYARRMQEDVQARPEFYFKRFELAYTKKRKLMEAEELKQKFMEMELWLKGELPTVKNQTSCVGKWACDFVSACATNKMAGYTQTRELFGELSREQ